MQEFRPHVANVPYIFRRLSNSSLDEGKRSRRGYVYSYILNFITCSLETDVKMLRDSWLSCLAQGFALAVGRLITRCGRDARWYSIHQYRQILMIS